MKKLIITIFALVPLMLWAQDNTWERAEEEEVEVKPVKPAMNPKYLRGTVPEVDGKVVFSKTIDAPGKSAADIFDILQKYLLKMTKETNQINSRLAIANKEAGELAATCEEWPT